MSGQRVGVRTGRIVSLVDPSRVTAWEASEEWKGFAPKEHRKITSMREQISNHVSRPESMFVSRSLDEALPVKTATSEVVCITL